MYLLTFALHIDFLACNRKLRCNTPTVPWKRRVTYSEILLPVLHQVIKSKLQGMQILLEVYLSNIPPAPKCKHNL